MDIFKLSENNVTNRDDLMFHEGHSRWTHPHPNLKKWNQGNASIMVRLH